ncbi:hypothetical protein UFOVP1290_454 [uncultured Caudovirales phage]|uniref:Uncharacterized protein n=1 Tax=uncultured Caudovirales phage TaxID=2100421 RepID=A0A6J5RY04_9CAUD|nr:hypothetical protein UFOVP1290_454 [uncultured Caudovirales phage]
MKSKSRKDPRKIPNIDIRFKASNKTYSGYYRWMDNCIPGEYIEVKNSIFYDRLIYEEYTPTNGGNSHMIFKSAKNGHIYHMFMPDFHEVLIHNKMVDRQLNGEFTFTKKSNSVCIRLIIDEPPPNF